MKYEKVYKAFKILRIDGFPLFVNPNLVFSYEKNGKHELGALWLVPKLQGFKKDEIGMFCEALYRFLIKNYSENFQISHDHCIVVDTYKVQRIVYSDLVKGDIPFLIDKTLKEITEL